MTTESRGSEALWSSAVSEIWGMFLKKLHLQASASSQLLPEDKTGYDWCREGCRLLEGCSVIGEESRRVVGVSMRAMLRCDWSLRFLHCRTG